MNRLYPMRSRGPQNCLRRVAGVVLILLLTVSIAQAAQPATGTLTQKMLGQQVTFSIGQGPAASHWAGSMGLQLDRDEPGDGRGDLVPVFCIQVNVSTTLGNRYVADGQVIRLPNGCQIRYLLARYPADTALTAAEAAARQLAIWYFSDALDLETIRQNAIRARAIELAVEANLNITLHGCPGMRPLVSEFTLDPHTATVPAGQSAIYTVRVSPPAAATTVTVRITGAAALADGRHEATLPLSQGVAAFAVRGASTGTATITARLPDQLDAGTVFSSVDQQRPAQRLVLGAPAALAREAVLKVTQGPGNMPSPSPTSTATAPSPSPTSTATAPSVTPTPPPAASPTSTPTAAPPPTSTSSAQTPQATPHRHTTTATQVGQTTTPETPSPASGPAPGLAATPVAMPLAEAPRPASLPRTDSGANPSGLAPVALGSLLIATGVALRARCRLIGAQ